MQQWKSWTNPAEILLSRLLQMLVIHFKSALWSTDVVPRANSFWQNSLGRDNWGFNIRLSPWMPRADAACRVTSDAYSSVGGTCPVPSLCTHSRWTEEMLVWIPSGVSDALPWRRLQGISLIIKIHAGSYLERDSYSKHFTWWSTAFWSEDRGSPTKTRNMRHQCIMLLWRRSKLECNINHARLLIWGNSE
jgi:hypothetical protein